MSTAIISQETCLVLGESDFLLTTKLQEKKEAPTIIATKLLSFSHGCLCSTKLDISMLAFCEESGCKGALKRMNLLKRSGVAVRYYINATKISELFKGQTFSKIYWNMAYDLQFFDKDLEKLFVAFLLGCSNLQTRKTDEVHVILNETLAKRISSFTTVSGYRLTTKEVTEYVFTRTFKKSEKKVG